MAEAAFKLTKRTVHPRLALELAQDGIEKQLSFVDGVDSKLTNVGGFSSAIVTVFGGLLAVSRRDVPEESIWLLVAAGGVYVVLMLATVYALWPRNWLYTPHLRRHHRWIRTNKYTLGGRPSLGSERVRWDVL